MRLVFILLHEARALHLRYIYLIMGGPAFEKHESVYLLSSTSINEDEQMILSRDVWRQNPVVYCIWITSYSVIPISCVIRVICSICIG